MRRSLRASATRMCARRRRLAGIPRARPPGRGRARERPTEAVRGWSRPIRWGSVRCAEHLGAAGVGGRVAGVACSAGLPGGRLAVRIGERASGASGRPGSRSRRRASSSGAVSSRGAGCGNRSPNLLRPERGRRRRPSAGSRRSPLLAAGLRRGPAPADVRPSIALARRAIAPRRRVERLLPQQIGDDGGSPSGATAGVDRPWSSCHQNGVSAPHRNAVATALVTASDGAACSRWDRRSSSKVDR